MSQETIFIGMDLGSYKTSVTSSNGRRECVVTAVGWPKDQIARSMLGRDVVFGDEIREQRLALNVVRPFEKGVLKYQAADKCGLSPAMVQKHMEAARLLVAHTVGLTQPPINATILGVIGAPSRASVACKQVLLDAAEATFDAVAIVPEPFAVAYGMNRITNALVVDIGAGTTDICPLHGTFPSDESQKTIPLGGDAIDQRLGELIREMFPDLRISEHLVRDVKEKYGAVQEPNERAIVMLPIDGRPQACDLTVPIYQACRSIVEPILRAIGEIVAEADPDFQQALRQNILLAGGGSQLKGLDRALEEGLKPLGGGNVTKVYDSVFAGATGALKLAMEMPRDYWDQLSTKRSRAAA